MILDDSWEVNLKQKNMDQFQLDLINTCLERLVEKDKKDLLSSEDMLEKANKSMYEASVKFVEAYEQKMTNERILLQSKHYQNVVKEYLEKTPDQSE